jgi:hypothetical protein
MIVSLINGRPAVVSVGDYMAFGGHEWIVLDIDDGHALLIMEDIYGEAMFHHSREGADWE